MTKDMAGMLAAGQVRQYLTAGNATVTVRNEETGNRFTFKVTRKDSRDGGNIWFVKVLTGPNNDSDYLFIGTVFNNGTFRHSGKSQISSGAQSVQTFQWLWKNIDRLAEYPMVQVWHEGRCGRCGRKLTVPSSIGSGYGPECIQLVGFGGGTGASTGPDLFPDDNGGFAVVDDPGQDQGEPVVAVNNTGVRFENGKFFVRFGYGCENFSDMLAWVKGITGRRYDPETKEWMVPESSGAEVLTMVERFDLPWGPGAEMVARAAGQVAATLAGLSKAGQAENVDVELGGQLRPFQNVAVHYAAQNGRVLIGDQMGLGKTVEALAILESQKAYPAVIIVPASVKRNWEREAKKWVPNRTVQVVNGRDGNGGVDWTADILIVNYDILSSGWVDEDKKDVTLTPTGARLVAAEPAAVVLDESHFIKGHKSQRTKACLSLAKLPSVRVHLAMTGTPILNRPIELLPQLQFLGHLESLGGFWNFVKRYCNAHQTRFGWDMTGADNLGELNTKLRQTCLLRRTKEEVLSELPPLVETVVPFEIDNWAEYRKAKVDLARWLTENKDVEVEYNAWGELAAEQLRRIEALKQVTVRGKMAGIREWLQGFVDSGTKVIVFAWHQETVKEIAAAFDAPYMTSETPVGRRQEIVDRFNNDPTVTMVVLNIKVGGVGLNMQAASHVAFVEFPWTHADVDQGLSRAHRMGQKAESVNVYYLVGENTIDEDIVRLIGEKQSVAAAAIDGAEIDPSETGILTALIATMME